MQTHKEEEENSQKLEIQYFRKSLFHVDFWHIIWNATWLVIHAFIGETRYDFVAESFFFCLISMEEKG